MLLTANNQVELWKDTITEAALRSQITLTENRSAYLVFALIRFMRQPFLLDKVIALSYLKSNQEMPRLRGEMLAETADTSLLIAGLFPERTKRLNVSSTYFIDMSQVCYHELALVCDSLRHKGEAELYREVGDNVKDLACVLSHTRSDRNPFESFLQDISQRILH